MALYLGILIFSFIITSLAIIPFINFLYRLHFTSRSHPSTSPKSGTPVGGGLLIIFLVTFMFTALLPLMNRLGIYFRSSFPVKEELNIIFLTFISFGLLGLYDDLVKTFRLRMSFPYKLPLQLALSLLLAFLLHQNLRLTFFNLPFIGVWHVGIWYIPVAASAIFMFTRGFDRSDHVDGLASGVLLISLLALWAISVTQADTNMSVFIALWIGSLIAFLYFNVYPARIWLGNGGSLAFGATLAVTGLLLGKISALLLIGALFPLQAVTSFLQSGWMWLFHRQRSPILSIPDWLVSLGWPEPKVTLRLWLVSAVLALAGLGLSLY